MRSIALVAAWHIEKVGEQYFCPMMHWLYIRYASTAFDKVYLVAPVRSLDLVPQDKVLVDFDNLEIVEMPHYAGYMGAQSYKKQYKEAILYLGRKADFFYCRVPDPFSWMPALYTSKPVVMHYVGDIVEATKQNINFSCLKKKVLLAGYYLEQKRIDRAARRSIVYTNGVHLHERLQRKGIHSTPVISSTMSREDFVETFHPLQNRPFRLIYVGYLRYAKGMDTMMKVILELKRRNFLFTFDIVGGGEMFQEIREFVVAENLEDQVTLHGHIDDRKSLFNLQQNCDLFFFPSLSEGSPRVIIEAMGQGLPVLSTPVGSLPMTFVEGEEILFFPFKDVEQAAEKIIASANHLKELEAMRIKSYNKVKDQFTIERFLGTVMDWKLR